MGDSISQVWLDPEQMVLYDQQTHVALFYTLLKLFQMMLLYGYFLFQGAELISNGSELLLLTPYKDLIGTLIIPILGAVPEGAMVLFSGLGSDAQKTAGVGIGTLAGSSIMLLTINWAVVLIGGRVDLDNEGNPMYSNEEKLTKMSLFETGVENGYLIHSGSLQLVLSIIPFVIVQAFALGNVKTGPSHSEIFWPSIASIVFTLVLFIAYCIHCCKHVKTTQVNSNPNVKDLVLRMVKKNGHKELFEVYDMNNTGKLDTVNFYKLLNQLGYNEHRQQYTLNRYKNEEDEITLKEFTTFINEYAATQHGSIVDNDIELVTLQNNLKETNNKYVTNTSSNDNELNDNNVPLVDNNGNDIEDDDDDDDDDDDGEMPEDLEDLSYEEQQKWLIIRALYTMAFGTAIVMIFSDPMVSVFSATGTALDVDPFYIAFFLAPLASNAKEWVASWNYANKKSKGSFGIAVSSLQGSACMNNTYCLFIFLLIIVLNKDLTWTFTAETLVTVITVLIMAVYSRRKNCRTVEAFVIGSLYFLAFLAIYFLKTVLKWN